MKKKFLALSLMLVMASALILTGCSMNSNEYEKASHNALTNTYNILVTDKDDLSTHGNFTYVNKTILRDYNEEAKVWETTEKVVTYKRVGTGSNTVFEETTYQKSDDGLGGIKETTTKYTYTAITSEGTTNYYILKEYKEDNNDAVKSINKTYLTEEAFISDVYQKVAKNIMNEVEKNFYFGGEKLLYVAITGNQPEIKGNKDNCTFKFNYNSDDYDSSSCVIERTEASMSVEIKDGKFYNFKTNAVGYENGVELESTENVVNISYSAEISRITSVEAYV